MENLKAEIEKHAIDGGRLTVLAQTLSTNTLAKQMAKDGAKAGSCIIAENQTGGRGRSGREFFSPNGGLYLSMILRPNLPVQDCTRITTAACVAVCRAIERLSSLEPKIKWVNDVFLRGKKVCGILTEAELVPNCEQPSFVVLGIGINLQSPSEGFPTELSMAGALDCGITRAQMASALIRELDIIMEDLYSAKLLEQYRAHCPEIGKMVEIVGRDCKARVIDITQTFGLLVEHANGLQEELSSGEARIIVDIK